MTIVRPQFTYSPDGVLETRSNMTVMSDEQMFAYAEAIGQLMEYPGVSYREADGSSRDEVITVTIEAARALDDILRQEDGGALGDFLASLKHVMPAIYHDREVDYIASLKYLTASGFLCGVHDHFQRWLNTQTELDDAMAREVLQAMAVPFRIERQVGREFRCTQTMARAAHLGFAIQSTQFDIYSLDAEKTENGSIQWRCPELIALDGAVRLTVEDEGRQGVDVSSDHSYPWLYELSPQNVEHPRQLLSLLMGIWAMAYRAQQYAGTESVLSDAVWH